jgi:hypothetical protein
MLATSSTALPATITLAAWDDPVVEAHGFGPRSPYVEVVYLPLTGPASLVTYRRLGSLVELGLAPLDIDVADLAASVGLGSGTGRSAPMTRTLDRLTLFGLARWLPDGSYAVRRALAPLPEHRVRRLPGSARRFHEHAIRR